MSVWMTYVNRRKTCASKALHKNYHVGFSKECFFFVLTLLKKYVFSAAMIDHKSNKENILIRTAAK